MKYVITGSLGHISQPIAASLIEAGHEVVIISSNAAKQEAIEALGAKALIGSLEDAAFLTRSFEGAHAVYLMIPPYATPSGWREWQNRIGDNFVTALRANGTTHAVVLSSIGAHLGDGAGPIDGLADLEKKLESLPALNVLSLRPSYFFYNLFGQIPMIKNLNIMGANFGNTEEKLVLTDTGDIAAVATEALLSLNFTGQTVKYIASDERTPADVATVLSNAIGKPGIPWVSFSDEQSLGGMLQMGLPKGMAEAYTQMGKTLREGRLQEDYWKNRPAQLGKVKLEDFAQAFAAAYQHS